MHTHRAGKLTLSRTGERKRRPRDTNKYSESRLNLDSWMNKGSLSGTPKRIKGIDMLPIALLQLPLKRQVEAT